MKSIEVYFDSIKYETDKAMLIEFEHDDIWIPLSLIECRDNNTVTIPLWFAEQHELEVYET